jgi:nucleoid DNA-binding protein
LSAASSRFGDRLAVESVTSVAIAVAIAMAIAMAISMAVAAITMTMAEEERISLSLWGSLGNLSVEEEADHCGKNDAGDVVHGV